MVKGVCRLCRREGIKLFLKGERCYMMAKCAIDRGRASPGMHGPKRRRKKESQYGVQLREKQRLKQIYRMRERQFRSFFDKAQRKRGVTGEELLRRLEQRLDNVAFKLGFAISRSAARQAVLHGHVRVNGRKVDIPSFQVKAGDVVEVKDHPVSRQLAARGLERIEARGVPPWLEIDKEHLRGRVVRAPERADIQAVVNEQLIVELYSK